MATPDLMRQLRKARRERRPVRVFDWFQAEPRKGYVLDFSREWVLLAIVGDTITFDGFDCVSVKTITRVERDPWGRFPEAVFKKRGERVPARPPVKLESVDALISSAGKAYPLVVIERARVDPDVVLIGKVISVDDKQLSLLEIDPNAVWDREPRKSGKKR